MGAGGDGRHSLFSRLGWEYRPVNGGRRVGIQTCGREWGGSDRPVNWTGVGVQNSGMRVGGGKADL
jgi:hypothetical protein